ncbi:MAG: GIY-YIG nuclease family protein [Chloroflexi bacterium]|nr:GIY-YIG nuclease family protein [Chloroflexota bacterium]
MAADRSASPADLWRTPLPGTYALLIQLDAPALLMVGRLGAHTLAAGWYVYTGSALGGLGGRISRHARQTKRLHWHVDHLLAAGRLIAVAARLGPERVECQVAALVASWPGARRPIARFGASDCRCPAHLAHFTQRPSLELGPGWQLLVPPV